MPRLAHQVQEVDNKLRLGNPVVFDPVEFAGTQEGKVIAWFDADQRPLEIPDIMRDRRDPVASLRTTVRTADEYLVAAADMGKSGPQRPDQPFKHLHRTHQTFDRT